MRASNHSPKAQESKQNTHSLHYPVSSRAYNKKDYAYISTFNRVSNSVALRTPTRHDHVELSHEQSDGDIDLFVTTSTIDCATSMSSASNSTSSSAQSYAKYGASLTDMESDPQHQRHSHHECPPQHHRQHHHHHQLHDKYHHDDPHLQFSEKTGTHSPRNSTENPDLQKVNDEKSGSESNSEFKDNKFDLPDPAENGSVEVKEAPIRLRAKVRSRHIDTPAVLPKFGSWNTRNPSSGEAYTLIFKRLRDEKKSGAVPVCGSPTHPKAEEADEPLRLESKAKEPLCPNSRARKDFSRRKEKTTSHQEAAQYGTRWILCCKTSVLDD